MKIKAKKVVLIILAVWAVMFALDFARVVTWHRPLFCIPAVTSDDGGSGLYIGSGYWYMIRGNFMPEEDGRVTEYSLKLAGIPLLSGGKD